MTWQHGEGRGGLEEYLAAFEQRILHLTGQGAAQNFTSLPGVRDLLSIARPRPADAKGTTYLPFRAPGEKMAQRFSRLRKTTMLGEARAPGGQPPKRLLTP